MLMIQLFLWTYRGTDKLHQIATTVFWSPFRFEDKLDEEQFVHSQGGAQHPELVDILGCNVDHLPTVYLGMPLDNKHKEIVIWDGITGKVEKRLIMWKTQYLLLGGRFILINSDLDSLPTYVMSLFLLSLKVVKKLDKLRRDFLCMDARRIRITIWWNVTMNNRYLGGLDIKKLRRQNDSLLMKWLAYWKILIYFFFTRNVFVNNGRNSRIQEIYQKLRTYKAE